MRPSYSKTIVLVGAVLNAAPLSMLSYFGNLLPYIDSYYHAHADNIGIYIDPLWTASVFVGTFILGMIFATPAERCFGINLSILISDICISLALCSGYFALKEPLTLALIFGGLQGIFVGLVYSMVIKLLLVTLPEQGGMATGLMSAGPVMGALLFIGVAFAVINPNNVKPDLKVNNKVYFSDPGLIGRVPNYFLVVGAMTTVFTLSGVVLMYIGSWQSTKEQEEMSLIRSSPVNSINAIDSSNGQGLATGNTNEALPLKVSNAREHSYSEQDNLVDSKKCEYVSAPNGGLTEDNDLTETNASADLSPREMVKTARFWLVWLAYVSSNHTNYVHLNLYKSYGQRIIRNDSLLVTAGIISTAGMIIVRPLVGVASDKIGIRGINVILNAASSIFMSLMILVLHTCPWMYLILLVMEYMSTSPHTLLFSLLTAYEFGKTHCGSNMGLIRSGNIILVLLEPFFVNALIKTIGWDWLFLTGSFCSVIATVAIMALDNY